VKLLDRIWNLFGLHPALTQNHTPDRRGGGANLKIQADEDESEVDEFNPFPEPVVIEFQDFIDLHSIPPRLVKTVVEDYIEQAHRRRVRQVRIIHGKGIGVQREMVRSILAKSKYVVTFQDAPAEAGGWGATIARLT